MIPPRNKELLMIFAKNPSLGKVKTRIAKSIGEEGALKIYNKLLLHTHEITKEIKQDKFIFYSDFIPEKDIWDEGIFKKCLQDGNDLGERMFHAFLRGFLNNYESVMVVGTDCASLTKETIQNAFLKLESNDFVIGPAKDGGYYLLGMKKLYPNIFLRKSWSTNKLFLETVQEIIEVKGSVYFLPELSDVDTVEDLAELQKLR